MTLHKNIPNHSFFISVDHPPVESQSSSKKVQHPKLLVDPLDVTRVAPKHHAAAVAPGREGATRGGQADGIHHGRQGQTRTEARLGKETRENIGRTWENIRKTHGKPLL